MKFDINCKQIVNKHQRLLTYCNFGAILITQQND